MIESTRVFWDEVTDPYRNLALEEYFLDTVASGECILYLWQNTDTVVIGRNQNCWKECRVDSFERGGGHLVRRLSGGGAVYHDRGNLNFTFLVRNEAYDLSRQLEVILRAVRSFGINAVKEGRNDLSVDGRKFSGNAFYRRGKAAFHHGTLLVSADMGKLASCLSVPSDKLRARGVPSVLSRVANLEEYCPSLTAASLRERLITAFGEVYGCIPKQISPGSINGAELAIRREFFASRDWICNRSDEFQFSDLTRFSWGGFEIALDTEMGLVKSAVIYSDALDSTLIYALASALAGCPFSTAALCGRIRAYFALHGSDCIGPYLIGSASVKAPDYASDIASWLAVD